MIRRQATTAQSFLVLALLTSMGATVLGDDLSRARAAFLPAFEEQPCTLEAVALSTRDRAIVSELASRISGMVEDGGLSSLSEFEGENTALASVATQLIERGTSEKLYVRHLRLWKKGQFVRYDTQEDFFGEMDAGTPPHYKCTWILRGASSPSESECYFINHVANEARIAGSGSYLPPPLTWEILTYPEVVRLTLRLLIGPDLTPGVRLSLPVHLDEIKLADLVAGRVRGMHVESEISAANFQTTRLYSKDSEVPALEIRLGIVGTNAYPLLILVRHRDGREIQTAHAIYYKKGFAAPAGGMAFNLQGQPSKQRASVCIFNTFDDAQEVPDETFALKPYHSYRAVLDQVARTYYTNGVITTNVVGSDEQGGRADAQTKGH